jgi:hypothetical protein
LILYLVCNRKLLNKTFYWRFLQICPEQSGEIKIQSQLGYRCWAILYLCRGLLVMIKANFSTQIASS